jgi:hypothetical protein
MNLIDWDGRCQQCGEATALPRVQHGRVLCEKCLPMYPEPICRRCGSVIRWSRVDGKRVALDHDGLERHVCPAIETPWGIVVEPFATCHVCGDYKEMDKMSQYHEGWCSQCALLVSYTQKKFKAGKLLDIVTLREYLVNKRNWHGRLSDHQLVNVIINARCIGYTKLEVELGNLNAVKFLVDDLTANVKNPKTLLDF